MTCTRCLTVSLWFMRTPFVLVRERERRFSNSNFVWLVVFKEKSEGASRPSEHPLSQGEKYVKTFRWDHRLQIIQDVFMAFKRVPLYYGGNMGSSV